MKSFIRNQTGFLALILMLCLFGGAFGLMHPQLGVFDFSALLGKFGVVGTAASGKTLTFVGTGGTSLRQGFLFSLSIIPTVMFALGIVACAQYYGALTAAQRLLTPVMRPLFGLPGAGVLALVTGLNSSDAGGALIRRFYEQNYFTDDERTIFCAFQFSASSAVTVYLTGASVFAQHLSVGFLTPLVVVLVTKTFGCNLMRLVVRLRGGCMSGTGKEVAAVGIEVPTAKRAANGYQALIAGMRQGWDLGVQCLLPNIMIAYVLIAILQKIGLLSWIGEIANPVMTLFGLPGVAVTVLVTAWLSGLSGAAVAAGLCSQGLLTGTDVTILAPAIFLMGAQIQYMGRVLAVAGLPQRDYKWMLGISLLNAMLAMWVMRLIV